MLLKVINEKVVSNHIFKSFSHLFGHDFGETYYESDGVRLPTLDCSQPLIKSAGATTLNTKCEFCGFVNELLCDEKGKVIGKNPVKISEYVTAYERM